MFLRTVRTSISLFLVLTVVTGIIYPMAITVVAQTAFPSQSRGSVISRGGHAVGSELIGQGFTKPGYFWSRPSATGPVPYNAAASSGSNLGPSNPALESAVRERIDRLRATGNVTATIPLDLVTTSASGLDPHISPAAAEFQIPRVAQQRGVAVADVEKLVKQYTAGPQLGVLGESRVNVLQLNLALDAAFPRK